jgi:hypothetical protein
LNVGNKVIVVTTIPTVVSGIAITALVIAEVADLPYYI